MYHKPGIKISIDFIKAIKRPEVLFMIRIKKPKKQKKKKEGLASRPVSSSLNRPKWGKISCKIIIIIIIIKYIYINGNIYDVEKILLKTISKWY